MAIKRIKRKVALADMDIRFDENGKKRIFSIKFVSKAGKLYFVPQAYESGAGRMNMNKCRMRGIQPCDCKGNAEGHVYPVVIDLILEYNGMKIIE